jgi:hypothetical protein
MAPCTAIVGPILTLGAVIDLRITLHQPEPAGFFI